ncbi:MAG: hypothetical protein A3C88_02185 [Candidatus Yanofskybacteria bacterium RIFCSPHIGHO2_02_FULL_50_12]|uniref:TauD/TfdA-like domain-containing protein n=1 Tax=Candidatus Yanofskybacteria bacterium RIFCSPHIGHO2_02_FULL_50_12 TaxID=1802685 RepID=A0A1F8FYW7_9BACT|nr:MAG: hypothetical protein A3C88_02185 [Candidatus Yanofskybacteria bacterium RIFCSPHIGHO2_02_FULL_50_12]
MSIPILSPLIRKFYAAPPRFAGGPILNLLGYHVLRVFFFNLSFALRRNRMPKDARAAAIARQVIEDGVAVLPNFFPADVFAAIKTECESKEIKVSNERAPHVRRDTLVSEHKSNPILEPHLANNEFINSIVAAAVRKDILITPKVQFEISYYHEEDIGKPTTDVKSDNLHFDVSYPTIKCFLYLTDVDERNAATMFVKRSHKMTLARLWMEYKMSVMFYWKWNKERRATETPEVSQEFLRQNGLEVMQINGKANTMIIENTMGFHGRGQFLTSLPRHWIIVTYRELESLKYLSRKQHRA